MKHHKALETEIVEDILTITLHHTEIPNPMCMVSIDALREVMQEVYDNNMIKSVLITGEGAEIFATGTALEETQSLNEFNGRKFAEHGQEILNMIENCHKPVLAAVNGIAMGGGFALALACHLRMATEHATFWFPEVTMGLIPSFGSTQRLTHLLGKAKALELMVTGEKLSATEAQRLGMVSYVASNKEVLIQQGRAVLRSIMSNDPLAVGMLISCTNAAHNPDEDGYQTEANCFAHCCKKED